MANLCNKINNRGDVTEVGRKIVKIRSPVDRVRVRARVRVWPHSYIGTLAIPAALIAE